MLFLLCNIQLSAQEKKPWIEFGSSVRMSVTGYQMTGQDDRQEPFSYFFHGTPTVTIKGFDIPFHFILSNHQKKFQQPFNRFGIAPEYKWFKGYLGYNTMALSKYTFSNRQFLGAGVELNPGKLRTSFLYGRLQAAVREDSVEIQEQTSFLSTQKIPRFERRAYGGKIGYGTRLSYFDITGMKAYDVADDRNFSDTTSPRPQENVALGIHSQLQFQKHFQLRFDLGASVFTRDTTSESYELNKSLAWIGNILQPKTSTQVLFAGEAGIGYNTTLWGVQINYKRIDPDFKSMGIYYLQTDIEQWTLAPHVTLLGKKLRLRGSLGIQKNNLYNTRLATNKRIITSANAQWNQSRFFQLGVFYTNFGLTQTPGLRAITDSTRVSQINGSYGISPSFFWGNDTWQHQLYSTISLNKLSFNKSALIPVEDIRTIQFNGGYSISSQGEKSFSLGGLFTWLNSDLGNSTSKSTGIGGNASYNGAEGKWNLSGQAQYFINTLDENPNGHSIVFSTDLQYQLRKTMQFFLLGQLIQHTPADPENAFTEKQATLGLQFNF
ncbi:MAG TPA: hypothetical protein VFG10_16190 [Saprospiraceae bacterium]|nr:hypothetical protein [Saprospiraceae bacterium]